MFQRKSAGQVVTARHLIVAEAYAHINVGQIPGLSPASRRAPRHFPAFPDFDSCSPCVDKSAHPQRMRNCGHNTEMGTHSYRRVGELMLGKAKSPNYLRHTQLMSSRLESVHKSSLQVDR